MNRRSFLKSAAVQIGSFGAILSGCGNPLKVDNSKAPENCTFGVITDAQYCYTPDKSGNRYFRDTLHKMNECVKVLNSMDLDFVIHLGDFIDRYNSKSEAEESLTCFQELNEGMRVDPANSGQRLLGFSSIKTHKYHVLGNHDYWAYRDHYSIDQLYHDYGLDNKGYYTFSPRNNSIFKFIVLDSYQNGSYISREQRRWLYDELASAEDENKLVILFSHIGIYPDHQHNWIKNEQGIFDIFDKFSCIAAYMNGHNHSGNYGMRKGVHYINFKGMVESPYYTTSNSSTAFSVVSLSEDKATINGFGRDSHGYGDIFADGTYQFSKTQSRSFFM